MALVENDSMALQGLRMSAKNKVYPDRLISAIRVMNIVSSLQLKDLYGIDNISEFKPSRDELKLAEDVFERYKNSLANHQPGDEYQLVAYLAQEGGCSPLLSIVDEETPSRIATPSAAKVNDEHERFSEGTRLPGESYR